MTRVDETKVAKCLEMLENCLRRTGSFLEPKPDGKAQTEQIRVTVKFVLDELEALQLQRESAQGRGRES
jgi:hypothetical protein